MFENAPAAGISMIVLPLPVSAEDFFFFCPGDLTNKFSDSILYTSMYQFICK